MTESDYERQTIDSNRQLSTGVPNTKTELANLLMRTSDSGLKSKLVLFQIDTSPNKT